ncbi:MULTISPECIES: hypothetical protein [unclassified Pseudomonas]|uniref:hypothetical protein n=1 Tax=unclassified Pseudomonas TaxID=196821 RepID=UPI001482AF66|nr:MULTISPECIES: hypothetical protein [unclassified Pseudomonas]MDI2146030.1 hypothetical protein [Pseudomonas sp. ITA]
MNSVIKLTPVQSRERYLNILRNAPKADFEPPVLDDDNPLLPDESDDDPNQLHKQYQGFSLKVNVLRFDGADDNPPVDGFINLAWDGTQRGPRHRYTTPIDSGVIVIPMELPEGFTNVSGPHTLSYVLNHGGNTKTIPDLIINIDTTPPDVSGLVTLPPEVETNGITKPYLDAHGFVLITMPTVADIKKGDEYECYFGSTFPTPVHVGDFPVVDPLVPVTFRLTTAMVGTEEGEKAIFYYRKDRKGNRSLNSPFKRVNVTLTDPPANLEDPSIPLFDNDTAPKKIDLADARMRPGVGIIDQYDNFVDGDELEVTVDGVVMSAQKIAGFPTYVEIPYSYWHNGDLGEKTIEVSYQIKRGTIRHPASNPPKNDAVLVDLRRPGGGEGPDDPNPDFLPVDVQGAGGNPVNVLTVLDKDQDVEVTVAAFPGIKDKDIATLIWNGVEVTDAEGGVLTLDGTETDLDWTIDWSVVDAGGNGTDVQVTYKVTNPDVNDNEERSLPQDVDVFIRPGSVPQAKFQHLDPDFEYLNCPSLRSHPVLVKCIEVFVPAGEPQLEGQTLTFTYQGYSDSAGSTVIPNNKEEVTYKPDSSDVQNGFTISFPYQKFLDTGNAWGAVSYSAVIDGRPTPSERHLVRVLMRNGDTTPCTI